MRFGGVGSREHDPEDVAPAAVPWVDVHGHGPARTLERPLNGPIVPVHIQRHPGRSPVRAAAELPIAEEIPRAVVADRVTGAPEPRADQVELQPSDPPMRRSIPHGLRVGSRDGCPRRDDHPRICETARRTRSPHLQQIGSDQRETDKSVEIPRGSCHPLASIAWDGDGDAYPDSLRQTRVDEQLSAAVAAEVVAHAVAVAVGNVDKFLGPRMHPRRRPAPDGTG